MARYLTAVGNHLFFIADDGSGDRELWMSDGTTIGTRRADDNIPGHFHNYPRGLTALGNTLFFTLSSEINGIELWRSNGTNANLVSDIRPGNLSSSPGSLTAFGENLFFSANDNWAEWVGDFVPLHHHGSGNELWRSDGTSVSLAADIATGSTNDGEEKSSHPHNLTVAGSTLFFTTYTSSYTDSNSSLWKSNGNGASLVSNNFKLENRSREFKSNLTAVGNQVFFSGNDGISGYELWKSDGTDEGTHRVADLRPGLHSSSPRNLTAVGNTLYFLGNDGFSNYGLWKSDGTKEGTIRINSIIPSGAGSNLNYPIELTSIDNTLLILVNTGNGNGNQLWQSDGSAGGTTYVADIPVTPNNGERTFTSVGNTLYFAGFDIELWALTLLPAITLKVSTETVLEDGVINLIYTFTRSGPTTSGLTISYAISGTADASDYRGATPGGGQTINFAEGAATAKLTIEPSADTDIEADESIAVSLVAGNGYTIGTPNAVTGTIRNDDLALISLAVSPTSVREDGANNLLYTFNRSGSTEKPLMVNYTVVGTATLGVDYRGIAATPVTKTISFAAGSDTATVSVAPTADRSQEANETVSLRLVAGAGYTLGSPNAVTGTILNDDLIGTSTRNILVGTALAEFIDGLQANDTLTGGIGPDVFGFRYGHSTLIAPDRITDFRFGTDKIDLFTASGGNLAMPPGFTRANNNNTATTLAALATAVFTDANGALAGNQALGANRAAMVVSTKAPIAGTYLFINDSIAARSNSNDLLVNLTGASGPMPGLGLISVGSVFA